MSAVDWDSVKDIYLPLWEAMRDGDEDDFFAALNGEGEALDVSSPCVDLGRLGGLTPDLCEEQDLDEDTHAVLGYTLLGLGVKHDRAELVLYLLENDEDITVDIDARQQRASLPDDQLTPLQIAIESNNENMVEMLIKHGADVNATFPASPDQSLSCLALAKEDPARRAIVLLLQQSGATDQPGDDQSGDDQDDA